MNNLIMSDDVVRKWWNNKMDAGYFQDFSYFFSYPNMAKFDLCGKNILEIGFGYGRETSQFCKLGANVYGVDITNGAPIIAINKLKEYGIENLPQLATYDGVNLSFEDNYFDFIYSCFVIQHMSKINAIKLIKESLRTLKSNGLIFFEFFGDKQFLGEPCQDIFSGTHETGMYNNAFDDNEIIRIVLESGGTIENIEDWYINETCTNKWVKIGKTQ